MSSLVPEAPRDQVESGFTVILRRLFLAEPDMRAIVFVDRDGECIDYCSALPPYDAKVLGAQMQVVTRVVREPLQRLKSGELLEIHIHAEHRDFVVRRLDDEYLLVAVVRGGMADESVAQGVEDTVQRLRREVGIAPPWWDTEGGRLVVRVRDSVGWDFAPVSVEHLGKEICVTDVIGRWSEDGGAPGGQLTCFRVRLEGSAELTLAYDPGQERWYRW